MSLHQNPSAEREGSEVLLTTQTGLDQIDLVQNRDGSVMIVLNDEQVGTYRWEPTRMEEGVSVYLRMIG